MTGVVVGGWEYVAAAYGLSFFGFAVYGASVLRRLSTAKKTAAREEA